ncbi:hypothetical protein P280DRAFT_517155 [Massarina eburnea CBS 473.64]|uniref:Uncharacterized protein n=1 Tax=Massarina eburnea CBS 473.64 TaxID=1395130 RepID=A0A6A6S6V2_9PLEO|nr:hypothetical protein P280DRAFT_517155 [Massarina eburnea CBS 473.64]
MAITIPTSAMAPGRARGYSRGLAGPPEAKPITRELILGHLCEPDEDLYAQDLGVRGTEESGHVNRYQDGSTLAGLELSLPELRCHLAGLVEKQQSTTDWEPEYDFNPHSNVRCLGGGMFDGVEIRSAAMAQESAMLRRIAKGLGTRTKEYEDLLAPLRDATSDEDAFSTASSYREETYDEMLQVLLAWNRSVAPIEESDEDRQELLDALEERDCLIDDAMQQHDQRTLNRPAPRLLRALHAFRPETASFQHQEVADVLIMVIANLRVARPDIDDHLKCAIFLTMMKEAMARMAFDKSYRKEKDRLHEERKAARASGYDQEADRLLEEDRQLIRQNKKDRAEEMVDKIKFGRRGLYEKVLEEMQELAVLQAAQLEAASELRQSPVVFTKIEEAMESTDGDAIAEVGYRCACDDTSIAAMLELNRKCLIRTRKFEAHDIKEPEARRRVKRERMDNPRTVDMMLQVVDDTETVRRTSRLVLGHMENLETSLETILDGASERFRTYQGGMQLIGEIDPEHAEAGETGLAGGGAEDKESKEQTDEVGGSEGRVGCDRLREQE